MERARHQHRYEYATLHYLLFHYLRFDDDIVIMAETMKDLNRILEVFSRVYERVSLK